MSNLLLSPEVQILQLAFLLGAVGWLAARSVSHGEAIAKLQQAVDLLVQNEIAHLNEKVARLQREVREAKKELLHEDDVQ